MTNWLVRMAIAISLLASPTDPSFDALLDISFSAGSRGPVYPHEHVANTGWRVAVLTHMGMTTIFVPADANIPLTTLMHELGHRGWFAPHPTLSLNNLGPILILALGVALAVIRRRRRERLVFRSPGADTLALADLLCRTETQSLIGQMVADMRVEYFEALKAARPNRARWLLFLHYIAIARALTLDRAAGALVGYVLGVIRAGKP